MNPSSFLLVSPGAVDGYPPVQYQARILADAGYPVTLVTMPLREGEDAPHFSHPGVNVRSVASAAAFGGRLRRVRRFATLLWSARRSLPPNSVEIAYDPIGLWYSDYIPNRPAKRIAHLHELLQRHRSAYVEKRLGAALRKYDLVVVPDISRGAHTQQVLRLEQSPLVVENYPLRAQAYRAVPAGSNPRQFEVVYCGSLGLDQKIDAIIRSMPFWSTQVRLILIGNDQTPTATRLHQLSEELGVKDRIEFLGWMDTPDAEARLTRADLGIGLLDASFEQWRTALTASNKRFQYMKAGLPQIGDTNPGVPRLLDGIGTCIGTDHHPEAIAEAVNAYAGDPARCAREGALAFERHRVDYNYECAFQSLHNIIRSW